MAYSKIYSQPSVLQLRSQKLNQQRFVIDEKNESKRKLSGTILPFSEHKPSLPKTHLALPRSDLDDVFFSPTISSPVAISKSQFIQPTQQPFSNHTAPTCNPNLVTNPLTPQCKLSQFLENVPIHPKESSFELDPDDPCRLSIHENLSEFSESKFANSHGTYFKSSGNPCLDCPPILHLLPICSLPSFPNENNLSNFVLTPIIYHQVQYSQIRRYKVGIEENMFPVYQMYLEDPKCNDKCFVLASRKRKKSKFCNYLITTNKDDLSREGAGNSGKLRGNFLGTDFVIYSGSVSPHCENILPGGSIQRKELSQIHYEKNIMGLRGPRRMSVVVPSISEGKHILSNHLISNPVDEDSKLAVQLENKVPEWNDESQTYILNFNGRVTQASVKNFQLIDKVDGRLVLQFGRIGKDLFTLDYSFPLCAVQAFGIALSSFERKFGCE